MKHAKALGLAMIAVSAFAAISGGTATATVLCKSNVNINVCGGGNQILKGSVVSGSKAAETTNRFTISGIPVDECEESSFSTTVTNAGSATTTVFALSGGADLTFNNCTAPTVTLSGGELEIHWISGTDDGTVTAKGFEIEMTKSGENCIYWLGNAFQDLGGQLQGGKPAKFAFSAIVKKKNLCIWGPSELLWIATYAIEEAGLGNNALYVTAG